MSKIEVNAIEPQTGTTLTVGASGDTISLPTNVTLKTDTIQNTNSSTLITQTNTTTITLGYSGATITINSNATQSGIGRQGAVNWDTTPKTTTVTAVSGVGYFINTTSAGVTVNLPAGSAGSIVALADYAATWNTNNVTVNPNGTDKIGGVNATTTLSTQGQAVTFVYVDSTQGWTNVGDATKVTGNPFITATGGTILTCGNFKTHVFTGPGTFTVTNAGASPGSNSVEYLVVAGGGGAGACQYAGGGGGGYRQNYPSPTTAGLPVTATSYPITVGSGGAVSNSGSPSIFSTITSTGGGAGNGSPANGGSGGGAAGEPCGSARPFGTGNTPPVSPPQGNPGGPNTIGARRGGGGGGAGAAGGNAGGGNGSPIATTFFGPTSPSYGTPGPAPGRYFAGGGGGGTESAPGSPYAGGAGGGGPGGNETPGTAGTVNTGGGGGSYSRGTGSSFSGTSAAGGSGIVIIRYKFQ